MQQGEGLIGTGTNSCISSSAGGWLMMMVVAGGTGQGRYGGGIISLFSELEEILGGGSESLVEYQTNDLATGYGFYLIFNQFTSYIT